MNKELVVKYKVIITIYGNGNVKTKDTRYNIKISKNKLIKWLIKNNFRFSMGIRVNSLIENLNYIEVWSDDFMAKYHYERNKMIDLYLKRYEC